MFRLCFGLTVPRNNDFTLNVDRIAEVVELEKPKCIFLTSPNNPDGRYKTKQKKREDLLFKSFMVNPSLCSLLQYHQRGGSVKDSRHANTRCPR